MISVIHCKVASHPQNLQEVFIPLRVRRVDTTVGSPHGWLSVQVPGLGVRWGCQPHASVLSHADLSCVCLASSGHGAWPSRRNIPRRMFLAFWLRSSVTWGFPAGSVVRSLPGTRGSIFGSRRFPWGRKRPPAPVFLPGNFHGQTTLVGYSPGGCKELDTTE